MVMVLSIMIIVIGSIMIVGVPAIESAKSRAKMDVAMNSFLSLQNDIEEVVRGPIWVRDPKSTNVKLGPSRETEFELMGGTLSVLPNTTNITCIPSNCSENASNFTIIIPPSNITYTSDQEEIVYENGAVIRKYESGAPLMVSDPLISIYDTGDGKNITISIHVISINGTLSSTGGDGKAWVETRPKYYNQTIPNPISPNSNITNITIYSKYPEAWKKFFDKKLSEAGLNDINQPCTSSTQNRYYINRTDSKLEVQICGKESTGAKDIFLSVYESRLDIGVR
ncbi:hypothetical protein ANME2D_01082 [Candidatus Methanoperedens nitroreducens]|uniref:Archaeal flagellin-like protein n=2 Tax=Candidatus Methanoperedens nitratireducens TaxID=1392998 RepID=A0A062V0H9_9EURY|nr:hypothetical protein ANME2D_01082 [Candidatus Methanoperedens nitroreducens]